ncbi:MAG: hypothetical protein R2822_05315 [Spirosomataceae bacterium]
MKATCQHCQRCYAHQEVANAHTVFEMQETQLIFSSTDDTLGIDICQVCHKPSFWASLWHKIWHIPTSKEGIIQPKSAPEIIRVQP